MGDVRFSSPYRRVKHAKDRGIAIAHMADEDVIAALAAASRDQDPLLANILATEAMNRMRRSTAALEQLGEGVISVDADERITFANPAAQRALGYEGRALVGMDLHCLLHTDHEGHEAPREACSFARVLRTTLPLHQEEEQLVRSDGTRFPVAYTLSALRHEGMSVGAVLVFEDITDRRESAEALRESEERYRALADATGEAVLIHQHGILLELNRAAEEMFGHDRQHLLGRNILELVALHDHPRVLHAIGTQSEEPYEVDCLRSNGRSFRALVSARALTYRGQPARVAVLRDISPQRRLARELEEREEWYRSLFWNDRVAMLSLDKLGRFCRLNAVCERLSLYASAELEGKSFMHVVHPEDLPEASASFAKVIGGETATLKIRIIRKDGSTLHIHAVSVPIFVNGEVAGLHAIVYPRDATEAPPP